MRHQLFQVVQPEKSEVLLKLKMRADRLSARQEQELLGEVAAVAPDLRVNIQYVQEIPLTRSGKRKFVIGLRDTSQPQ